MTLTRRDAIKLGGLSLVGAAGLAVPLGAGVRTASRSELAAANFPKRYASAFVRPPLLRPDAQRLRDEGVAYYDITARQSVAQIVPGLGTPVYAYNGSVPGPLITVEQGTPSVVTIRNHLPKPNPFGGGFDISTHLHGSESLPEFDGYAADRTAVGFMKDYVYPNSQRARTLWYHDHGQHWTAQNVYGGLAAQYHIHDDVERALLPQGEFDVPLTVSDALFAADGSLAFDDRSHSGLWGDVILVNGRPWPVMKVKRRTYRFRILVASLSRSYRWRLSNGMPMQIVATDGGLRPKGIALAGFRHAPAERYEVVIDFSKVAAGTRVELLNRSNPNNVNHTYTGKVMAFDVVGGAVDTGDPTWNQDYDRLPLADSETMDDEVTGRERVVHLRVKRDLDVWTINGKSWSDVVASGYRQVVASPELNETQVWEIENTSGGWFHPIHLHLVDFKIIGRTGGAGRVLPHEAGPKDVVYVGEEETVRLLCTFRSPSDRLGRYMVHCHNLPHEDHDMMLQFSVGWSDFDDDPHDPVTAAVPVPDETYGA